MTYKLNDGRNISIPTREIKNLVESLNITQSDAIELWLSDNGYEVNEEQEKLDEKASKVSITHDISPKKPEKERKKPEIKVSDEKKWLFDSILQNLTRCNGVEYEDITVLNENKLIEVRINDKIFKIDIVQRRTPKKEA